MLVAGRTFSTSWFPVALWLYSSEQYSVPIVSKCLVPLSGIFLVCPEWWWYALVWRTSNPSLVGMPFCCCSSSGCLQFLGIVPQSNFLLPSSCRFLISWLIALYSFAPSGSFFFFFSSLLLSHRSRTFSCDPGLFNLSVFSKDLTVSVGHCCVEGVDESVHVSVSLSVSMTVSGANFPPIMAWKTSVSSGSLQFIEIKLHSCDFLLFDPLQVEAKGHHHKVVIASNVCSWECSCFPNFDTVVPAFLL